MQKNEDKTVNYEENLASSVELTLREGDDYMESGGRLKVTLDRLADRFEELGLSYALVGGFALLFHGVRRFTEDIDLLVAEDDLGRLRDASVGRGYVAIPGNNRDFRDAETGVRIEFVVTGQFPGDGKEKPVAFPEPASVAQEIDDIKVVNLTTLVELKLASGMTGKGRLQDLADVQRLISEHELTVDFAGDLNEYVREKFLELLE